MKLEISSKVEKETKRDSVLKIETLPISDAIEYEETKCTMVDIKLAEKEFVEIMDKGFAINEKEI